MRVLARYLILQLPGWVALGVVTWALVDWRLVSSPVAIGLWSLWIVKDLALYPFVRRAYDPDPGRHVGAEALLGQIGTVAKELEPAGTVLLRGELWRAEQVPRAGDSSSEPAPRSLPEGQPVRVEGVRGLTLLVSPESGDGRLVRTAE